MNKGVIWHNGSKGLALVTRSGSHSLFKTILTRYYPQFPQDENGIIMVDKNERWHPVMNLPDIIDISRTDINDLEFAVVVRNPVERFRSSCARLNATAAEALDNHLDNVHFWSLKSMGLLDAPNARYFLFETQLNDCASYLGLYTPITHLNGEQEDKKPILTPTELAAVQNHYAYDIDLYQSLLSNSG